MKRTIAIFLLLAMVAAFFASCGRKSVGTSEHTSEFSDVPDTSDTYDDEESNETKKPIDNSMFSENLLPVKKFRLFEAVQTRMLSPQ